MSHYYLSNGIGIDEANIKYEGDEMVLQDDRLKIEVEGSQYPRNERGQKTEER